MQYEKVLPPIYDTIQSNSGELVYPVLAGCEDRTYRTYYCENNSIDANSWEILPPNKETVVSKRIMCEVNVTVTSSHVSAAAWPADFQLRAYAPLTALDLATVGVNGKERSYQVSELIQTLTRYNNPHDKADIQWSGCPTKQDYGLLGVTEYGPNLPRNFAGYQTSSTGSGTLLTKTFKLRFPIVGPGLEWGNDLSNDGLTLLSRISIRLRWATNLVNTLFDCTETLSGMTYAATLGIPSLTLEYLTPSVGLDNFKFLSYNMKDYQPYVSIVKDTGSNLEIDAYENFVNQQSSTISYSTIPSAIYVYCAQPVTDLEVVSDARVFSDLSSIKINWMNKTINYESTEMSALQAQSISNGFNVPMNLQNGYTGMCVKFVVGRDLPLGAGQFPGSSQISGTIQVMVSGKNQVYARKLNLYVLVETDATMTIVEGSSDITNGFAPNMTETLAQGDYLPETEGSGYMAGSFSGGNIKKPIKRHLLAAWRSLMQHKSEILGDLNKSMGIAQKYKAMQGSGVMGGSVSAGRILGGNYQSRF